jgi:fructokinase
VSQPDRSQSDRDDVLVVGEALVDIVEQAGRPPAEHPGGSPANVALALARLGRRASLLTRIGNDARGRAIRDHLEGAGVTLVPGSITDGRTSTATAHLDPSGVASYDFDLDWRLPDGPAPDHAIALHTGSIAAFLPPGGDAVLGLVRKAAGRATITYDPNARPRLMGDPAARWLSGGPAVVVVTRGGAGAVGLSVAGRVDVPAPAITVVDTVGAGDSFMAGLLDHLATLDLLGPARLPDLRAIGLAALTGMLHHAARIAAITCTRAGANPPTRAELQAWSG